MHELNIGLSGKWLINKFRVEQDGTENLIEELNFDNLITDSGLNSLNNSAYNAGTRCYLGTGTSAPSVSDTSLGAPNPNWAGAANFVNTYGTSPDYISSRTGEFNWNPNVIVGNFTEIGVFLNGATLFSRTLIKDAFGNPTTLTIASNEYVKIYYTIYLKPNLADFSGSFLVNSDTINYVGRVANIGSWAPTSSALSVITSCGIYSGGIGPITGYPSGVGVGYTAYTYVSSDPYVNNSNERAHTLHLSTTQFLPGQVPIRSFTMETSSYILQFQFTPPIAKDSTMSLSLRFKVTWGRAT